MSLRIRVSRLLRDSSLGPGPESRLEETLEISVNME